MARSRFKWRETGREGGLPRLNTNYYAPPLNLIVGKEFKTSPAKLME